MREYHSPNPILPEAFAEDDLWGPAREYNRGGSIELGTIGYDDSDEVFDPGTSDPANGGFGFIRVQLYRGRGPVKLADNQDPAIGHGRKLLCGISSGIFRIPPKGTRCYVALPAGYEDTPGAGCVIATVEKNPLLQFNDDRVHMNFGEDKHIVIRAKSITLTDPTNQFLMLGTSRAGGNPMILCQDATGSGWTVQSGVIGIASADGTPGHPGQIRSAINITPTKLGLVQTSSGGSQLKLEGGQFIGLAQSAFLQAGGVFLGKAPTPANPVLWGITGVAGAASLSVFVSPV